MSKQSIGNGTVLGSQSYLIALNHGTVAEYYLGGTPPYQYETALNNLAVKAYGALQRIATDLASFQDILPLMDATKLSALSELVGALEDVVGMQKGLSPLASSLRRQLENPSFYAMPSVSPWDLKKGLDLFSNPFGLNPSRKLEVLKAMVSPTFRETDLTVEKDRSFARDLQQISSSANFLPTLQANLDYREGKVSCTASNGQEFASAAYISAIKSEVYPGWFGSDLSGQWKGELDQIVSAISRDVQSAQRNNDYVLEEDCRILLEALENLDACGVTTWSLGADVTKLDWYTPIDPRQVELLQSNLNRLGLGNPLLLDGVYGPKTSEELGRLLQQWDQFMTQYGSQLEQLKSLASNASITAKNGLNWINAGKTRLRMTKGRYGSPERLLGTETYMRGLSPSQQKKAAPLRRKTRIDSINPNYKTISQFEMDALKWAGNNAKDVVASIKKYEPKISFVGNVLTGLTVASELYDDLHDADKKFSGKSGMAIAKGITSFAVGRAATTAIAWIAPSLMAAGPAGWVALAGVGLVAMFVTGKSDKMVEVLVETLIDNWADFVEVCEDYEFDESRIK